MSGLPGVAFDKKTRAALITQDRTHAYRLTYPKQNDAKRPCQTQRLTSKTHTPWTLHFSKMQQRCGFGLPMPDMII